MKSISFFIIATICWSFASGQNRNTVQVSVGYPWVANTNYTGFNLYQLNAGYNYSLSKHFAMGGNYGVSAHGWMSTFSDLNGTMTLKEIYYMHNIDVNARWMVNPDNGYRLSVDLSAGLTIEDIRWKVDGSSSPGDAHAGYNVNPSVQLNHTFCNRFDIFLRGGYCLTSMWKQPVHIINAGLGSSYSF